MKGHRIQRVLPRSCRLPGTKVGGLLIRDPALISSVEETFAGRLSRGNALWLWSWWTSPQATESVEERGLWQGGLCPAQQKLRLPSLPVGYGCHACRSARVVTDAEQNGSDSGILIPSSALLLGPELVFDKSEE